MEWYEVYWIQDFKDALKNKLETEFIPRIRTFTRPDGRLKFDYDETVYDYYIKNQTRKKIISFEVDSYTKDYQNDQKSSVQMITLDVIIRIHNSNIANQEDENNDHVELLTLLDNYIMSLPNNRIKTSAEAVWFNILTGQGQTNVYWLYGSNYGAELHLECKTEINMGD